jgi:hypothetical protein
MSPNMAAQGPHRLLHGAATWRGLRQILCQLSSREMRASVTALSPSLASLASPTRLSGVPQGMRFQTVMQIDASPIHCRQQKARTIPDMWCGPQCVTLTRMPGSAQDAPSASCHAG